MKYETQLTEVNKLLPAAKNILIALPTQVEIDDLAAGLALYLSLEQLQKSVSVASDGVIRVGHSHLFGIGQIQNKLPAVSGGDFTITLGSVVAPDGTVPTLKDVDWAPSGPEKKDLKLVFHVVPGQKFEPAYITPGSEGGNFDLIFTIGATSLESLGSLYTANPQLFSQAHLINVSNKQGSVNFGASNVVDSSTSSVSEITASLVASLHSPLDKDIATNLLAGIYAVTNNLQSGNVGADTFEVIAVLIRAGGQKPGAAPAEATPSMSVFQPAVTPASDNFTVPPVVNSAPDTNTADQPSPEEAPSGEGVSPEVDWLTPKIYKGSSLG